MRSFALAIALLALVGCGGGRDPAKERLVEDAGRSCAYVLPPHWIAFDSELR
jgi:Tfp pilus assembly protein PilP